MIDKIISNMSINLNNDQPEIKEVNIQIGENYEEEIPCIPHVSYTSICSLAAIVAKLHERVKELESKLEND